MSCQCTAEYNEIRDAINARPSALQFDQLLSILGTGLTEIKTAIDENTDAVTQLSVTLESALEDLSTDITQSQKENAVRLGLVANPKAWDIIQRVNSRSYGEISDMLQQTVDRVLGNE